MILKNYYYCFECVLHLVGQDTNNIEVKAKIFLFALTLTAISTAYSINNHIYSSVKYIYHAVLNNNNADNIQEQLNATHHEERKSPQHTF